MEVTSFPMRFISKFLVELEDDTGKLLLRAMQCILHSFMIASNHSKISLFQPSSISSLFAREGIQLLPGFDVGSSPNSNHAAFIAI
jgi:hypothetical protein